MIITIIDPNDDDLKHLVEAATKMDCNLLVAEATEAEVKRLNKIGFQSIDKPPFTMIYFPQE